MRGNAGPESLAGDVFAWALNVVTSVGIVFTNKLLMDPRWGYGFSFGETTHCLGKVSSSSKPHPALCACSLTDDSRGPDTTAPASWSVCPCTCSDDAVCLPLPGLRGQCVDGGSGGVRHQGPAALER